jgi:CelD/BcsL family acetyltransferase involved in cellulose biosynthesis
MQQRIWQQACVETLARDGAAQVVTVDDATGPRAGIVLLRRGVPARLCLAGAEELWEPVEAPCADEAAAAALVEKLLALGAPLRFGHHPADSLFVSAMRRLAPASGLLLCAPVAGSPFLRLDARWRDPETALASGRRSDLRRMARKAAAHGPLRYERLAPGAGEAGALFERAMAVEGSGWKARAGTSLAANRDQAAFFSRYVELAGAAGVLRISFLRLGEEIAAMQLAVETENAYWLFKIGYDERFADCSPGSLLMLDSIGEAARKGLATFEFLGKSAAWTRMWTTEERANVRLRYYPRNASGFAAMAGDGAAAALRRAKGMIAPQETKTRR